VSGFKKSGIFPFNPEIFTAEDFIASELNELPIVANVPHHSFAETSVPLDLGCREFNFQATEVEKSETVTASTSFHVDDIQKATELEASADKKKGKSVPIKGLVPKTKTKSITEEDAECLFCGELYSETGSVVCLVKSGHMRTVLEQQKNVKFTFVSCANRPLGFTNYFLRYFSMYAHFTLLDAHITLC
jgi:hypothetical protein